jgi:hypothetical protein
MLNYDGVFVVFWLWWPQRKGYPIMNQLRSPRSLPADETTDLPRLETFGAYLLKGHIRGESDAAFVTLSRSLLLDLLRPCLLRVRFDAEYYRRSNPDLAAAEAAGQISSLHEHYLGHGYFENRLPCRVEVDATWYTGTYTDVGEAIIGGRVASPEWHFETFGFREGRLPQRDWSFADLLSG